MTTADRFSHLRMVREPRWRWILAAALVFPSCSGDPTSPNEVGQLSLGAGYDVFVAGETGFVSTNDGIAIIDVHDMGNPRLLSMIHDDVIGFHVENDTLFAYGTRLALYDIGNAAQPQLIAQYSGARYINGARKRGDLVYSSLSGGGIEVIDFSNMDNPRSVTTVTSTGQPNDLVVVQSVALVANSSLGLERYDLSNPTAPQRLEPVPDTRGAWDIHVVGGLLYLGCHSYGVKIIDISDPTDPVVIGSFQNGGETYGVYAVEDRLYTADLQQGVEVLDINQPESPTVVWTDGHYHPHDIYSDGRYVYLADQDRHFVVLPLDGGGE